jgi:hypothetical protein
MGLGQFGVRDTIMSALFRKFVRDEMALGAATKWTISFIKQFTEQGTGLLLSRP